MRKWILTLTALFALAAAPTFGQEPTKAPTPNDEETIQGMGRMMAQNLATYSLTEKEFEILVKGMREGLFKADAGKFNAQELMPRIQAFAQTRQKVAAEKEKKESEAFLAKAAAEKGAVKTDSGLIYQEIKAGTGENPKATDRVKVHYHGTLRDGTVFDSSVDRGQPATFPLNGVIKCWTEGMRRMKVGGKSKLICPSDIAYGDRGAPPKIKPGAALTFEVELIEIVAPPPTPAAGMGHPPVGKPMEQPAAKPAEKKEEKKDDKK